MPGIEVGVGYSSSVTRAGGRRRGCSDGFWARRRGGWASWVQGGAAGVVSADGGAAELRVPLRTGSGGARATTTRGLRWKIGWREVVD